MTTDDEARLYGFPVVRGPDGVAYLVSPDLMKPYRPEGVTISEEPGLNDSLRDYKIEFRFDMEPLVAGFAKINSALLTFSRTMETTMTFDMRDFHIRPIRRQRRPRNHRPHRRPHRARRLRR